MANHLIESRANRKIQAHETFQRQIFSA